MSNLKEQIKSEMITAMRNKEQKRVAAIRLLTAAIKQREVDERIELDDTQVLAIIDKMLGQRKESIKQFSAADRQDLIVQEQYEIDLYQEFLPPQLSEAEINDLIKITITKLSAASIKDMGKVMNELKPQLQGRADISLVSKKIKELLS